MKKMFIFNFDLQLVLDAYRDGKKLQYLDSGDNWMDINNDIALIAIIQQNYKIRIKPETKTVPLDFDDIEKRDNLGYETMRITLKNSKENCLITGYDEDGLSLGNGTYATYQYLADHYNFINGEPCSKTIEV